MLSTPNSHQPEFSIDLVRGVLIGRIYVPCAWAELSTFSEISSFSVVLAGKDLPSTPSFLYRAQ